MLSIVIPSHNDKYLHQTIRSLLDNARGEIEIVPVLDGYIPAKDPKVDEPQAGDIHEMGVVAVVVQLTMTVEIVAIVTIMLRSARQTSLSD